ncbi:MAG: M48 family metalloprotease [Flavisolibacter sp.]
MKHLLFVSALLVFSVSAMQAQDKTLYNSGELSKHYYSKQRDSIKKAWVCPIMSGSKETQKKFKEIWDKRTDFLIDAIDENHFVHDSHIFNYVQELVDQLQKSNKDLIKERPFLLLDRSQSVNAYAVGGNIIVVNLGLVAFTATREEMALIIAHELSHNILNHAENAMKQRAEWLTSDEYKDSLDNVLNSKYNRLSRLKKILETYSFDRNRHQRYKESEADSLAIVLLKNCNIPFQAEVFLRLDSADREYQNPLNKPVKEYFASYKLPFEDSWTQKRSKGLSTKTYNFNNNSKLEDSLKTHPDCAERYRNTVKLNTPNAHFTALPSSIVEKANKMIIWNLFSNMNLTQCLYRVMLEKDKGLTDEWYDFMMHNAISALYYSDKELMRFQSIGVLQKEYISKNYYELQTMLEQIPSENLHQYCNLFQSLDFWKNMSAAEKAMKALMGSLISDSINKDQAAKEAKAFSANNSTSMYSEFAGNFAR